MAGEFQQTARVIDPLGINHNYIGTGADVASSSGELKSKLKTIVGTVLGVSNSEPATALEEGLLVPAPVADLYGDMRFTVVKVFNGKRKQRTIPLQDVDRNVNTGNKPDLTNSFFVDLAAAYEDPDYGVGWLPYRAVWEKSFSGRKG